ncbi:MAG: glycosyltransferase family 39 protein [Desulfobacterales bacterium]|nr:glycosyltransferase family 39 protein [Desulfobacterales bacterium]
MHTLFHIKEASQDYKTYLVVFLIAIGARIFFLVYIDEPILFLKYPFFAEKLAGGADIGERLVDLSPFYLYLLTSLKKIFGFDWSFVKFVHSFVGAMNCLLVYAVGTRVFRKEVGLLGALIFSVYANLIILESTLEPTVFVLLFNIISVYLLLRIRQDGDSSKRACVLSLLAGLFAGLSIITKPSFLLFLPLAAIWLLFFNTPIQTLPHGKLLFLDKKGLSCALLFCGAALLVVMPITVRNYVKLHDFVLVTADAGKVFFHGNGRGATALEGTGLPDEGFAEEGAVEPDYAHVLFRKTAAKLSGKKLSPSESSGFWTRRAFADIADDPVSYIKLEAKKLFYFFNDYEMHYIASAYKEYKASLAFPFVRYGIISSLAILGMVLSPARFKELFLIYGMVFVYLLSGMLFLVQARYRTPAVPYLCLFAAYGIYSFREMLTAKNVRQAAMALIIAGLFFALTHFAFRSEVVNVDRWQEATKTHYQIGAKPLFKKGRYQEAITDLNKSIAMAPDFSPAYNLRGKACAILGMNREALVDFKKVISLSPSLPEGYKNAGFLYLLQGDTQTARDYLSKTLTLAPHDTKVREAFAKLK